MKKPRLLLNMYNSFVNDSFENVGGCQLSGSAVIWVEILIHVTSTVKENLSVSTTIFGACV